MPEASVTITLDYLSDKKKAVNEEYYELSIDGQQIRISATTPHGIFNGAQTLLGVTERAGKPIPVGSNVYSGLSGFIISGTDVGYCPELYNGGSLEETD